MSIILVFQISNKLFTTESRVDAVVRAHAFHQCGADSISWPAVICGLSVLDSVLRGFSLSTLVFPSHQKPTFDLTCSDSVWFAVSSISKATELGHIHWDLKKVIVVAVSMHVQWCCINKHTIYNRLIKLIITWETQIEVMVHTLYTVVQ